MALVVIPTKIRQMSPIQVVVTTLQQMANATLSYVLIRFFILKKSLCYQYSISPVISQTLAESVFFAFPFHFDILDIVFGNITLACLSALHVFCVMLLVLQVSKSDGDCLPSTARLIVYHLNIIKD